MNNRGVFSSGRRKALELKTYLDIRTDSIYRCVRKFLAVLMRLHFSIDFFYRHKKAPQSAAGESVAAPE